MTLFYLSFASDTAFLGATVVEAAGPDAAVREATRRGLNPGGEIAILRVPREAAGEPDIVALRNRLADDAEMAALGGRKLAGGHGKADAAFRRAAVIVCEDCNPPKGTR